MTCIPRTRLVPSYCLAVLGLLAASCGAAPEPAAPLVGEGSPSDGVSAAAPPTSCSASSSLRRTSKGGQGSSVVLARWGERDVALLADADRRRVSMFDLAKSEIAAGVDVEGTPSQLLLLDDGRVVVSLEDRSEVVVLAASESALTSVCTRQVAPGPTGLATDGTRTVVASTAAAVISVLDAAELGTEAAVAVPRLPRGVLVLGESIFVSHVAGTHVSELPLVGAERRVTPISTSLRTATIEAARAEDLLVARQASQAFTLVKVELTRAAAVGASPPAPPSTEARPPVGGAAPSPVAPAKPAPSARSKIVVPMVSVDPGVGRNSFQNYYGPPPTAGVAKIAPTGLSIDPSAKVALTSTITASGREETTQACMLPRAAVAGSRGKIYVACAGTDEVMELEGRRHDPLASYVRRFAVPPGPTGVALSDDEKLLVAFSQFDAALTLIDLESGDPRTISLDLGASPLSLDHRVGRELFHRANDARITGDGIACASCHPGGLDDGVVWQTPEGPRQTIALAGKLEGTEPFGWTRGQTTLSGYIESTCSRLGGSGLPHDELNSLASYVRAVAPLPAVPVEESLRARGAEAFVEQDCISCHLEVVGTNHQAHRIVQASGRGYDEMDTPSLFRVGMTGPYFHDGRYATLEDLLGDRSSTMGRTRLLKPEEQVALAAFLRSL